MVQLSKDTTASLNTFAPPLPLAALPEKVQLTRLLVVAPLEIAPPLPLMAEFPANVQLARFKKALSAMIAPPSSAEFPVNVQLARFKIPLALIAPPSSA